jgi:sulfonate transport system ATP-binding protein
MAEMASAFRRGNLAFEDVFRLNVAEAADEAPAEIAQWEIAVPQHPGTGMTVELDGVAKSFADQPVLRDIRLSIRAGEFVAIVGRSGCGKSTLLRLIAGLDRATGGTLLRDGTPVNGISPDTRFMFQEARLLPWKSVLDNVLIGVTDPDAASAKMKAHAALKLVGLEDRADDWPSVLSGGQRQRVALARALVGNPRLLLFDEPLGALDALTRLEMQRLIERLWRQRGFTAVLVTHDVSEAVTLADRVVLIEQGRVAMDLPIDLPRPRARDGGFVRYEQRILDRVMTPGDSWS